MAIVITHPPSQSLGTTKRIIGLAQGLQGRGVRSTLVSPYPTRPKWWDSGPFLPLSRGIFQSLASGSRLAIGELMYRFEGVGKLVLRNVKRVNAEVGTLSRQLSVRLRGSNVSLLHAEQHIGSIAACHTKGDLQRPVVADIQNLWTAELVEGGFTVRGSPLHEWALELEMRIALEADGIFVPSQELKDHFVRNLGAKTSRVWVIPHGGMPRPAVRRPRGPPFRVVYSGLLNPWVRIEPFVEALSALADQGIDIELFATNRRSVRKRLSELANGSKLRVEFFWFDRDEDYFQFLSTCHIGIVPWKSSESRSFGMPAKMLDYLSAGLPVVATGKGSWMRLIEEKSVGIVSDSDPVQIARAVRGLISDPPLWSEASANARELVSNQYSWTSIASTVADAYRRILEAGQT